jgi:hypothetical protein
LESKY